jgi:DNA polymerase-2
MNTFYGEAGNAQSPFYNVMVAGSITSKGIEMLNTLKTFVENKGYRVWYGDTDSNYASIPDSIIQEIEE